MADFSVEMPFIQDGEPTWVCVACGVRFSGTVLHAAWLSWVSDGERSRADDCRRLQGYRRAQREGARC